AVFQTDVRDGLINRPELTQKELKVYEIINQITDQEGWEVDVLNDQTTANWKEDMIDLESDHISEAIADLIFTQLKLKAKLFNEPSIQGAVAIFSGSVVKSDRVLSNDLRKELNTLVQPLETVPAIQREYRPDSRERVVDLVNPSLYTPIKGKSRQIAKGQPPLDLDSCFTQLNKKQPVYSPGHLLMTAWLPCEVAHIESKAKITSYINNLHPNKHRRLYDLIEEVVYCGILAWNLGLGSGSGTNDDSPAYDESSVSQGKKAQAEIYAPAEKALDLTLLRRFEAAGLQVVVQMTNIELTPAKPDFSSEDWHLAGTEVDGVCAIAHYFYSCENATEPRLAFRQRLTPTTTDEDLINLNPFVQVVGEVEATEGRLIAFPNTLQSRLQDFTIKDRSRFGHVKILTLYLLDPAERRVSTSTILPQQKAWWVERAQELKASGHIGDPENELLATLLVDTSDDEPYFSSKPDDFPISINEVRYRGKPLGQMRKAKAAALALLFEKGRIEQEIVEEKRPLPAYSE
ncbi:hypothetical protein CPB83DRAFT_952036, partial [Crepidotus variabilis]